MKEISKEVFSNFWEFYFRKSVRDFTVAKDYTDLGFLTFDIDAGMSRNLKFFIS